MPLMRDRESGVVREVHPRYLARFPDHYEEVKESKKAPRKRPSQKQTATPENISESDSSDGNSP